MNTLKQILATLVGIIATLLGVLVGRHVYPKCPEAVARVDTLTVYDTVRVKQPATVSQEVIGKVTVRVKQVESATEFKSVPPRSGMAEEVVEVYTGGVSPVEGAPTVSIRETVDSSRDSVEVEIPIERKVYQTEDYRAVVEGFRASLVSVDIYRRTQYVDRTTTARVSDTRRWSFGPQVGYGVTFVNGRAVGAPYVGVGAQFSLFKW